MKSNKIHLVNKYVRSKTEISQLILVIYKRIKMEFIIVGKRVKVYSDVEKPNLIYLNTLNLHYQKTKYIICFSGIAPQ